MIFPFYDFYWLCLLEGIVPNKSEQVLLIDFSSGRKMSQSYLTTN